MKKITVKAIAAFLSLIILVSCLASCSFPKLELPDFVEDIINKTPLGDLVAPLLSENTLYKENAYMVYQDSNGYSHIIVNGKELDRSFDGEIELIPAKDNSFAYVFDDEPNDIYMYIVKDTKIEQVSDRPASDIIAYAGLEPGIVFVDTTDGGTTGYYLYNERVGTKSCAKVTQNPDHFIISDDAETVVYTTKKDDTADRILTLYKDEQTKTISTTGAIPVAVSMDGRYIYNIHTDAEEGTMLYVFDTEKDKSYSVPYSRNFLCIVDMNVKGDEVLFCTGTGLAEEALATLNGVIHSGKYSDVKTSLYKHDDSNERRTTLIGNNVIGLANMDENVVAYKTFLDKYFTTKLPSGNVQGDDIYTYHLSDKYKVTKICSTTADIEGQFSPDGKYFYFVNDNMELKQVNLKKRTVKNIYDGSAVGNFAVTEKGNLFIFDSGDKSLYYYNVSTQKCPRYNHEVEDIFFHSVTNKLYFTSADSESTYVAEEGEKESIAEIDNNAITGMPYFSNNPGSKYYVAYLNNKIDAVEIYYTENGKKYDKLDVDIQELLYYPLEY